MTLEHAARLLIEAATEAILTSEKTAGVVRQLHTAGIRVNGLMIEALIERMTESGPAQTDADFLRKLHIVPDVEVRE